MDRRGFLHASLVAGACAGMPPLGWAQAQPRTPDGASEAIPVAGTEDARLRALLAAFLDEEIQQHPLWATQWGLDTGQHAAVRARLGDYSPGSRGAWLAARRGRLGRLRGIDARRLSSTTRIDYDVLEWQYSRQAEGARRFAYGGGPEHDGYAPFSPYVFSQITGPYQSIPEFLSSTQPLADSADAEAWLARLESFGGALDATTEVLRADASRGVLAPDFLLDVALGQLTGLRGPAAIDAPLVVGFERRTAGARLTGEWRARAASVLESRVYPALDRQRSAVAALRPRAAHAAGVWRLPDGEAFYAAAVGWHTTTALTPGEVHRRGLEEVRELTARLDALLRSQSLTQGSVAERLTALSARPGQIYPNDDAGRARLLGYLGEVSADMRSRLPRAFRTLPAAPFQIVRVPPEIEDGAPLGYARAASLDGTRPGSFYVNLKDTAEWPRFTLPTLAFHEALPGHQWQKAIAAASPDIPVLRRTGANFAAYGEGWALYAEELAAELGAYEHDPPGRIGLLQSLLFRAVRLVVDSGMHARRWSRERATDYMVAVTALPRGRCAREIDRYCAWPGQACSYKIGHAEWLRLRELARSRTGAGFDLKDFHEVLRRGPMPLVVLEQVITAG